MDNKEYRAFYKQSIEEIKIAENKNYLTIFAGAGVSVDSNAPSYNEIMDNIAKKLNIQEKDCLKLAEMFFIRYGENKYYETLLNFFPKSLLPNTTHNNIVNLNLKNLITTNWDDLFEKSIYNNGRYYDIIASDKDMGYTNSFAKFIKMHGCLGLKNIVFKEIDYLLYEENFPLIHNYIKSIFSTDLVVIVGYSLSDYNVKQIISWVNSKASNIKPAYFIKTDSTFNSLEFEYYKSKNIYIIYLGKTSDRSRQLNKFLERILSNSKDINIKNIISFLKIFDGYEYVLPQTFIQIAEDYFNLYKRSKFEYNETNQTLAINDDKIYRVYQYYSYKFPNECKNFIENISKLLNLKALKIKDKCFVKTSPIYIQNHIFDFDFESLKKELGELNSSSELSDEKELRKAFLMYQNNQYEYYYVLQKVSMNAFKNKNYIVWFISQFNKKYCTFTYETDNQILKNINKFLEDSKSIDLQDESLKLPKTQREILKPILNLDRTISDICLKAKNLENNLLDDYYLYLQGGFSINNNINEIINLMEQVDLLIDKYSLTIEFYPKVSNLYRDIITSVLVYFATGIIYKENKREKNGRLILPYSSYDFVKENSVDLSSWQNMFELIFFRSIWHFKPKELGNIVNKYFKNYQFLIGENANETIVETLNRILNRLNGKMIFDKNAHLFNNFLIICSKLQMKKETFSKIMDKFNYIMHDGKLSLSEYDSMNVFITNQYQYNKEELNQKKLKEFITSWIKLFIDKKMDFYNSQAPACSMLFSNVGNIFIKENIKFDDINLIDEFLTSIKKYSVESKIAIISNFIYIFYHIFVKEIQEKLKELIEEILKTFKNMSYEILELKEFLITNRIMPELKESILQDINKMKKTKTNDIFLKIKIKSLEKRILDQNL